MSEQKSKFSVFVFNSKGYPSFFSSVLDSGKNLYRDRFFEIILNKNIISLYLAEQTGFNLIK